MPQISVRIAAADDIPAIKRIADSNKEWLGFVSRGELAKAQALESLLVAEVAGLIVGYLCFYRCGKRKPGQFTVNSIAVDAAYRRQGVGRLLIASLAQMRPLCIVLKCLAESEANEFYASLGFVSGEDDIEVQANRRPLRRWRMVFKSGV